MSTAQRTTVPGDTNAAGNSAASQLPPPLPHPHPPAVATMSLAGNASFDELPTPRIVQETPTHAATATAASANASAVPSYATATGGTTTGATNPTLMTSTYYPISATISHATGGGTTTLNANSLRSMLRSGGFRPLVAPSSLPFNPSAAAQAAAQSAQMNAMPANAANSSSSSAQSSITCNTCNKSAPSNSLPTSTSKSNPSTAPVMARCSGCRCVNYCSERCQRTDWNKHRFLCRNVRQMDSYKMAWIKISSTIPGNFHRPVVGATIATANGNDAASATAVNAQSTPLPVSNSAATPSNISHILDAPHAASTSPDHPLAPSASRKRTRSKRHHTADGAATTSLDGINGAGANGIVINSPEMTDLLSMSSDSDDDERHAATAEGTLSSDDEAMDDSAGGERQTKKRKSGGGENGTAHHSSNLNPTTPLKINTATAVPDSALPTSSATASATPPASSLLLQPVVLSLTGHISSTSSADCERIYGPHPITGQICLVWYQCRHSSGVVYAKNKHIGFNSGQNSTSSLHTLNASQFEWLQEYDSSTPLSFVLGTGEVMEPWDACVKEMYKGEYAVVIARDENKQVSIYELQLVDFW